MKNWTRNLQSRICTCAKRFKVSSSDPWPKIVLVLECNTVIYPANCVKFLNSLSIRCLYIKTSPIMFYWLFINLRYIGLPSSFFIYILVIIISYSRRGKCHLRSFTHDLASSRSCLKGQQTVQIWANRMAPNSNVGNASIAWGVKSSTR